MPFFSWKELTKPRSVLALLEEQIDEAEKAFISNQGTAEHYQALADGNRKTISRLMASRAAKLDPQPEKPARRSSVRQETAAVATAIAISGMGVKLASAK